MLTLSKELCKQLLQTGLQNYRLLRYMETLYYDINKHECSHNPQPSQHQTATHMFFKKVYRFSLETFSYVYFIDILALWASASLLDKRCENH